MTIILYCRTLLIKDRVEKQRMKGKMESKDVKMYRRKRGDGHSSATVLRRFTERVQKISDGIRGGNGLWRK
jgi:hypothetical protein